MAETGNCTKGIGPRTNNCFGIKNGNTAPCVEMSGSMCVYNTPEESYEAFKIIWSKWYRSYPNWTLADTWTGSDSPQTWLNTVAQYYGNN